MVKYIEIHKNYVNQYEEAGATTTEEERVHNLHASLPPKQDTALNFWRLSGDQ